MKMPRQPNPLRVMYGYLHPERLSMKKMLELRDWINRAIAWREHQEQQTRESDV